MRADYRRVLWSMTMLWRSEYIEEIGISGVLIVKAAHVAQSSGYVAENCSGCLGRMISGPILAPTMYRVEYTKR
jgi:GH15 family glucan-1,4-alpha-glucosidase